MKLAMRLLRIRSSLPRIAHLGYRCIQPISSPSIVLTIPLSLGGLIASSIITTRVLYAESDDVLSCKPKYSHTDIASKIKEEVVRYRAKRAPNITGRHSDIFIDPPDSSKTMSVRFYLPAACTIQDLLVAILPTLSKGSTVRIHSLEEGSTSIALVYNNSRSSILLKASVGGAKATFTLFTDDLFSEVDLRIILDAYRVSHAPPTPTASANGGQRNGGGSNDTIDEKYSNLEALGVVVFDCDSPAAAGLDWSCLAGYDYVKDDIEDVVTAILHPEEFEDVVKLTRVRYEHNRPRAIIFEGPPGTGKTTCAKVLAATSKLPLFYIPMEKIVSKYVGESENRLAQIFDEAVKVGDCILFIDEIDGVATSREGEMHESTRKLLSVLLRKIEGFEDNSRTLLVCATNRMRDLDSALVSRFSLSINFHLPDKEARCKIFSRYAKHLTAADISKLADSSEGMSGRDIKDLCEAAERKFVTKMLRLNKDTQRTQKCTHPPSLGDYEAALLIRKKQISIA